MLIHIFTVCFFSWTPHTKGLTAAKGGHSSSSVVQSSGNGRGLCAFESWFHLFAVPA